jgi:hypothetical protein
MPTERSNKLFQLREELSNLDQRFEREMRARGFDPEQAENVALPLALAKLYAEREELRAKLERFKERAQGVETDEYKRN